MKVDLYDSDKRPDFYLLVRHGAPTAPLIDDVRTGVALMAPLELRVSGISLDALVDLELAGRLGRMIAAYGGALLRKIKLLESVPEGRRMDEVRPPTHRPPADNH
ncbi:hypothetical protein [Noviherbaspirillum autotrophicum]|uniref:Uncharacterized protein n=1 Tax=Noviherbaspirillum autotrophicum TaxID=709839 RepID=A0A0C2BPR4_9BURK|nr:hypothetical protein [Noviherbaspirillum autotrophicum]KIF83290.1 hypothetical protein TSA66_24600 [Noviherbaspirillum autotrophicum]